MKWKNLKFISVMSIAAFMLMVSLIIITPRYSNAQGGIDTQATASTTFSYQGQLKNNGTLFSGTCDFQFSLHDALAGGNQIGSQTKTNVAVSNGLFTVELDFGGAAFNGQGRWLNIQVRCPAGSGTYTTLTPRQPLTAAPYALSLVPGAIITGGVTSSPTLKVVNTANEDGIAGEAYGLGRDAIFGSYKPTTGDGAGVHGESSSPAGYGVQGNNDATTGPAAGVYGETSSAAGFGVQGVNNATTGFGSGVFGSSNSTAGGGVSGVNNATTGEAPGVFGRSFSPAGYGVWGANLAGGVGVYSRVTTGTAILVQSGLPVSQTVFRVEANGNVFADGTYNCGLGTGFDFEPGTCIIQASPADFAEMLPAVTNLEAGDVLIIGRDGKLARSTEPYQSAVVGVYSTEPGYLGGGQHWGQDNYAPLAVAGIVPVKVSAENGAIQPGDSLTTSSIPGHAMKANPVTLDGITFYPSGVVIGKALKGLDKGTGLIQMLVILQ